MDTYSVIRYDAFVTDINYSTAILNVYIRYRIGTYSTIPPNSPFHVTDHNPTLYLNPKDSGIHRLQSLSLRLLGFMATEVSSTDIHVSENGKGWFGGYR